MRKLLVIIAVAVAAIAGLIFWLGSEDEFMAGYDEDMVEEEVA